MCIRDRPGTLSLEEAIKRTPFSPNLLFFCPTRDGDYTATYRIPYVLYLKPVGIPSNPLCQWCHSMKGRCHFTCRSQRKEGQTKKEAREAWKRKREEAEVARNTMAKVGAKPEKCLEFALGLCFKQTGCARIHVVGDNPNGTVADYKSITCALARPGEGQRREGWAFCHKGPTCLYGHDHWSKGGDGHPTPEVLEGGANEEGSEGSVEEEAR